MTAEQWKTGRCEARLTQVKAAEVLGVSQPYLSQLEKGLREASRELVCKAAHLYKLPPTALPLTEPLDSREAHPDELQQELASLGYPGFEHVRASASTLSNPAEVVLRVVAQRDLDTRLVEALPWVLSKFTDLNWEWLRDRTKLRNAQNRLGYLVHLAKEAASKLPEGHEAAPVLSKWQQELEEARLANEGTLCRDSMPAAERAWLKTNRPAAAAHWRLVTSLTADQLSYASL
jgi:transcriptional regulator with XRE-family HTH domain